MHFRLLIFNFNNKKISGAEVNVHDFAGYTPLHHCLTSAGNETTFAMAKVLLGKGANPNAQNRFGCTPLVESVMTHNKEFVSLLVKNGADPHIKVGNVFISRVRYYLNRKRFVALRIRGI